MEKEVTQLQINMAELQKDITYIKEKIDGIEKNVNNFLENAPKTFAAKWIENLVYAVIVLMCTSMFVTLWKTATSQSLTKSDIQSMIEQNNKEFLTK